MRRGPRSYQYRVNFERRGPAGVTLPPGCFFVGQAFGLAAGLLAGFVQRYECRSRPLRVAAITRGLRRPWMTAITHKGFSSGA